MKRLELLLLSASMAAFSMPLAAVITPEMMGYEDASSVESTEEGIDLVALDNEMIFDEEQFTQMLMQLQAQMSPEVQQDIEKRESELKELGLRLNNLENELQEFEMIKASIKTELSEMIDQLAVLMSDQVELDQKVAQLAQEIDGLPQEEELEKREELDQLQADLYELAGEIDLLQDAIEEKRLAKVDIKLKIESHTVAIAELKAQMDKLKEAPSIDFSAIFGEAADENAGEMFEQNIESAEFDPYDPAEEPLPAEEEYEFPGLAHDEEASEEVAGEAGA